MAEPARGSPETSPSTVVHERSARSRGLGWFRAGGIGMLVVGLMHLAAVLAPSATNEAFDALQKAMHDYRMQVFGVETSMHAIHMDLNLSYSLFSLLVGASALASAGALSRTGALPRVALVHLLGLVAIVATSAAFRVMPPAIFYALVAAFFGIAALRR